MFKDIKLKCPHSKICGENCFPYAKKVNTGKSKNYVIVLFPHKFSKDEGEFLSKDNSTYTALSNIISDNPKNVNYLLMPLFANSEEPEFQKCIDRFNYYLKKLNPKYVLTLGRTAFSNLFPEKQVETDRDYIRLINIPFEYKNVKIIPLLSPQTIFVSERLNMSYWGFYKNYLNPKFVELNTIENSIPKAIFVDSMDKFNKMYKELKKAKYISVDTETSSLARRYNKLLSIQFAIEEDKGYFLPLQHKDNPFTPKQQKEIVNKLRKLFLDKSKIFIFFNAKFDLLQIKSFFNIPYFSFKFYDVMLGEYLLEENLVEILKEWENSRVFSLDKIAKTYGCFVYDSETSIDKADRTTIEFSDLDNKIIQYGVNDVCIPYRLFKAQLKKAKFQKYTMYKNMILYQMNNIVKSFVEMEYNGIPIDKDYLNYLLSKNSPIEKMLKIIHNKFKQSNYVKKASQIIAKEKGLTSKKGLFGSVDVSDIFNIRSTDHKRILFFDVMKLEPITEGKTGGKIDKHFQAHYKDVEEVKLLSEYSKLFKLKSSYIQSFKDILNSNVDSKVDGRIRPEFHPNGTVTGRASASKPNFQQIPQHSDVAKYIKRLIVADKGKCFIKVDYMAHEVRGLAIISGDKELAKAFMLGYNLRQQYRKNPSPDLKAKVDTIGDIHKVNASFFFGIPIEKVDKPTRQAVKGVIFGLIYGRSPYSIAEEIGKEPEYVEDLIKRFYRKYKIAHRWLVNTQRQAEKDKYVDSPFGRRRHLWGFYSPNKSIVAGNRRRAVNSPIQSMSADFSFVGINLIMKKIKKLGLDDKIKVINTVHDSLEVETDIDVLPKALKIVEWGLTEGTAKYMEKYFDFKLIVPLEVEFEIGKSMDSLYSWDFTKQNLKEIVKDIKKKDKEMFGG